MKSSRHNALFSTAVVVGIAFLLAGCAHYPVNPPFEPTATHTDYLHDNLAKSTNSDSLLVMLSFSGGGKRAAAFSYGVLKQLADTKIIWEGKERRLLDEVDLISSVSGGSFTAAYYGLFGDRIFQDYERDVLFRKTQSALFWRLVSPLSWPHIWSRYYDRSDLAADYYEHHFFEGKTFADLARARHSPYVVINAADMGNGARFEFTQDEFDLLRSDLSGVTLGRAVAASAAAPFYLTPITVRNYTSETNKVEPAWVAAVLSDDRSSSRLRYRAERLRSYLDYQHRPWIHLIDGGLCDNLAMRAPMEAFMLDDRVWVSLQKSGHARARRVVIIFVNGTESRPPSVASRESGARFTEVIGAISDIQPQRYNFETIALVRSTVDGWRRQIVEERETARREGRSLMPASDLEFYTIEVNPQSLPDASERKFVQSVSTSLNLDSKVGSRVRDAGAQLLRQSEVYQQLLRDLRTAEGQ